MDNVQVKREVIEHSNIPNSNQKPQPSNPAPVIDLSSSSSDSDSDDSSSLSTDDDAIGGVLGTGGKRPRVSTEGGLVYKSTSLFVASSLFYVGNPTEKWYMVQTTPKSTEFGGVKMAEKEAYPPSLANDRVKPVVSKSSCNLISTPNSVPNPGHILPSKLGTRVGPGLHIRVEAKSGCQLPRPNRALRWWIKYTKCVNSKKVYWYL